MHDVVLSAINPHVVDVVGFLLLHPPDSQTNPSEP